VVNLVYLRAGYLEMTEEEYAARTQIELSLACKVNSVNVQLFGMKVMQCALCAVADCPSTFKHLQVQMKPAQEEYFDDAVEWILKSNQEGGNSCIFKDTKEALAGLDGRGWILMERIKPRVQAGFTHEIGIYGGIILRNKQIVKNEPLGYLVRSKPKDVNESGVNAGYAKVNALRII
jgi:hypothetical protein